LKILSPGAHIITADKPTTGAACSALLAMDEIGNDSPLLISNADQWIGHNIEEIYDSFVERELDGGVVTFDSLHPRWSYVRLGEENLVIEAVEKRPISRNATAGLYYFRKGMDFVESTMAMIKKGASVDGQYYICPAYNEMILRSKQIGTFDIPKKDFHSIGTPNDVQEFEIFLRKKMRGTIQ
jgi:dTDP-glucose pyrophosphorylase